jgi:hypothetical protein
LDWLKNYYQILGISSSADQTAIRKAWLAKAQLFHPDHNPDDPASEELFKDAQEAYHVLSDPFLRNRYDLGSLADLTQLDTEEFSENNYFYAYTSWHEVRQFDEFPVVFTYTGRGRVFRKPAFADFFISGPPFVSHRMVTHEGRPVRETIFTYMVCPMKLGTLDIRRASIHINDKTLFTEPLQVHVTPNRCHFTQNERADGRPLQLTLHYQFPAREGVIRVSERQKNHTLLIPRSKTAFYFHSIGMAMKIVFMIWGAVTLGFYISIHPLVGAAAGLLAGGINCRIMYLLAGVKSKFTHARKYPAVQEYLDRGYFLGEGQHISTIRGNWSYNVAAFLF